MKLVFVLIAVNVYLKGAALPQFSWSTLPVFFHSSNSSGPYNDDALKTIARYPMVTIEKWMGFDIKNVDDEDEMAVTMKAIKTLNSSVSTYFYMNSFKARPEMTRMARQLDENNYYLRDANGDKVKFSQFYVFDVSQPVVRKWWLDTCLNATNFANGDGCFCDSSQHTDAKFKPSPPKSKLDAWGEGLLSLTREVQEALGDDKLLIGKVANQSYVKAVQIESFQNNNESITSLMLGSQVGQVVQAHVPVSVSCTSDLTDYIAAFLIGAEKYCYFGCGNWNAEGNDTRPLMWHPVYDKPLGDPTGPARFKADVWMRSFASGTEVTFDIKGNKGTIKWGQ